jgi:hypothetical protein
MSFAAVDLERPSSPLLWQDYRPDSSWWWSMAGLYQGVLLLHRYADARQPEAKGLLALDVRTLQVRWQQPDWAFRQISGTVLTVYQRESGSPVFRQLDLTSGRPLSGDVVSETSAAEASFEGGVQYPWHYPEEQTYFQPIARFVSQQLQIQIQPVKAFDYAERQGLVVVSYYLCDPSGLTNRLVVFDGQARVRLHETLATGLPGVGQATFLIRDNSLLFIRDKKELVSYVLS